MKLQYCFNDKLKSFSQKGVRASVSGQSGVTDTEDRWILEPVGELLYYSTDKVILGCLRFKYCAFKIIDYHV